MAQCPPPTANNFPFGENWRDLTECFTPSMEGFAGFDFAAAKLVTETIGYEWNEGMYKRLKFVEELYAEEFNKKSEKK